MFIRFIYENGVQGLAGGRGGAGFSFRQMMMTKVIFLLERHSFVLGDGKITVEIFANKEDEDSGFSMVENASGGEILATGRRYCNASCHAFI